MNAFGAERFSQLPTWQPSVPEHRDTQVDELGQENQMLDPEDVQAYSSNPPPDFEIAPVIFSAPAQPSPETAATHPTSYEELIDLEAPSGIRDRTRAVTGKTVEELSAASKEYIQVRRALADFVYSDVFRERGCDAITDEIINAIELFHTQPRSSEQRKIRHEEEQAELVKLLLKVPPSTMNPELHAQGVSELLDFVRDPFFCHGMWRQCALKPYVDSVG